jgi:hypothetical protein
MGTSAKFSGPNKSNPLLPSWLAPLPGSGDNAGAEADGAGSDAPSQTTDGAGDSAANPAGDTTPTAGPANTSGFGGLRRMLNSALRASGGNRGGAGGGGGGASGGALRRTLSGYVSRGTRGSRNATRRMSTSVSTAGKIAHFANQAAQVGAPQALRNLGLRDVAGRPAEQVFGILTDYFCPEGGTIDEAIAREAWSRTVEGIIEQGVTDIETMTEAQWQAAIADFVTNSIEARVINDIGPELTSLPPDVDALNQIQAELHDSIRGAVDDAMGTRLAAGAGLDQAALSGIARDIYEGAFTAMSALTSGKSHE